MRPAHETATDETNVKALHKALKTEPAANTVLGKARLYGKRSSRKGERDRPGRSSRRPADWLSGGERLTKK